MLREGAVGVGRYRVPNVGKGVFQRYQRESTEEAGEEATHLDAHQVRRVSGSEINNGLSMKATKEGLACWLLVGIV